jgi:integral membrane protein (TIGR00529 family)
VDILKLAVIFVLIVMALRKRLPVSITLFGAGLLAALLFTVPLSDLLSAYWKLVTSTRFLTLTSVVVLITTLGNLLKEIGSLERLSTACRNLYGGKRTAVAVMPPLIGLMPMPGGALLSAPLVGTVLSEPEYPPRLKTAVNYWYRHVVEHFMPIYPGIIVSEAITGMPVAKLALMQSPLAIVMFILGLIFFVRHVERAPFGGGRLKEPLLGILGAIWPIAFAILLYGALRWNLSLSVLVALVLLVVVRRPTRQMLKFSFRRGFNYKLVFLVFGILSFQTALEISGAIATVEHLSGDYGLPPAVIIFAVSFTAGLLTGMYAAFVALAYSLLAGFLYQPEIVPGNILLAYISGYVGMMLSPAHLCLILTNEYFRSDLFAVLRMLVLPALLLLGAGVLLVISPWPALFGG